MLLRNLVSKFDQLRPFLVIHRVFTIVFPFLGVFQFDAVRPTSNPIIPPRRAEDVNPRILVPLSAETRPSTNAPLTHLKEKRGIGAMNESHEPIHTTQHYYIKLQVD